MNLDTYLRKGEQALGRSWKAAAVRGALGIALGILILGWPDLGVAALVGLVGAYALVSGISHLTEAFAVRGRGWSAIWSVLDGLLGVAVGVAVIVWPDMSATSLFYAVALWAVVSGILQLAQAFVPPMRGHTVVLAAGGLCAIAFGVVMMWHPDAGLAALLALVAAFALVTGVMHLALAVNLRRAARRIDAVIDASAPVATDEVAQTERGSRPDLVAR